MKRIVAILVALGVVLGAAYYFMQDNVHTVVAQQYYRGAQLSPQKLTKVVQRYQIRSVINLRGAEKGSPWYDQEIQQAQKLGLRHFDLHLQAHTKPSPEALRQLMHLLQMAPKPVLIHCKGGADRTGLASALVLLLLNHSFETADRQISWRYFAFTRDSVGRLVMPYYQCFLQRENINTSKGAVLRWAHLQDPYACLSLSR